MAKTPANSEASAQMKWAFSSLFHSLGIYIIAGVTSSFLMLLFFVALTEDVFSKESAKLDDNLALWIHSFNSGLLDIYFNFFTQIGGFLGIGIITAVTFGLLVWRKHFHTAWLLIIAVLGGVIINQALKFFFHRIRPHLWSLDSPRLQTYSFPSGHSTITLCYCGFLIWFGFNYFKRPLARTLWTILMVFLIVMVGVSRIYLGEHYPTDVLAAFLSGGVWLLALFSGVGFYSRYSSRKINPEIFT